MATTMATSLCLVLLVGQAASQALWADEVEVEELVGTRWAEAAVEGARPTQADWRAMVGLQGRQAAAENEHEDETKENGSGGKRKQETVLGRREEAVQGRREEAVAERRADLVQGVGVSVQGANQTRQLEVVAFPVGIAIGAIGAALWPSVFPGPTTAASAGSAGDNTRPEATTGATTDATTTTFQPRRRLEDFPECGEKGSSTRVVGGAEVVEGEYPWLCSLTYNGNHICGMTLLSGPPHDTILVGAAHCYSPGDRPAQVCGQQT